MTRTSPRPTPPRLSLRGPADIIAMLPYLLGYLPSESLVLIGLKNSQVAVTMRMNLDAVGVQVAGPPEGAPLPRSARTMVHNGTEEFVAVIYSEARPGGDDPVALVRDEVREVVTGLGAVLLDALLVRDGRYRSLDCTDEDCCPPGGREVDDSASTVAAAAVYAGLVVHPNRETLVASLQPQPAEERDRLNPLIERLRLARERAAARRGVDHADRADIRTLIAAARRWTDGAPARLDDRHAARLGLALRELPVRDAVWMEVDDGQLDGRELWRALGTGLPDPWNAAPLFLFAWGSWRDGDGMLAATGAELALASDPHYSAAELLLSALDRGMNPRTFPPLRGASA